jgi:hypothetical protein
MNIALKLTTNKLNSLIEVLQDQEIRKPEKIADKCMFYLYSSSLKKMLKKQIDKADIFSNTTFKMVFKYEEATSLYLELQKIETIVGVYESNMINALINELHQKLY